MDDGTAPPAPGTADSDRFLREELQLAARNHGLPLEALRYPVTPVGLHYLLVHYDIPALQAEDWRLEIGGAVRTPLTLSLADLQSRPRATLVMTMECAGNGRARLTPRALSQPWLVEAVGTGRWTGTLLAPILRQAGIGPAALEVLFTGLDRGFEGGVEQRYARSLPLSEALGEGPLLAWELNGGPLPPQHGFPLRLIVPGWYGMASVKWLGRIAVIEEPFTGYQQATAYRFRQRPGEPGRPVRRVEPRSLMIPPGVPDFFTRRRFVDPGPCLLEGRAWSGHGAIESVEVSTDGGARWRPAELAPAEGPHAWHGWRFEGWVARPGDHELASRATDTAGNVQPIEPVWNLGGYAVNAVQRIGVTVPARPAGRAEWSPSRP